MADLTTLLAMFLKDLYSGTIGATSGVNVALGDGSASAPSLAFANATNTGFYRNSTRPTVAYLGADVAMFDDSIWRITANQSIGWSSNTNLLGTIDTLITRDGAANTLALKNAANAQTFRLYGTTTGPKYLSLSHDGTNGVIDTSSSSGLISIGPTNATDVQVKGSSVPVAVGSGYKIARGSTALDGSNPTTVATGLTSVVSIVATLRRNSALSSGTAFITHDTPSGANVDFYGWLQTGAASTNTENFDWIAVGT